jgi:hypothetical protein
MLGYPGPVLRVTCRSCVLVHAGQCLTVVATAPHCLQGVMNFNRVGWVV